MNSKFYFECRKCGEHILSFKDWFLHNQKCPKCGHNWVDTIYKTDYSKLKDLIYTKDKVNSLWHYFDFLPLFDKKNIVSCGEGAVAVDRWQFAENYAKEKYGLDCKVYCYRNDDNYGTGTFKDAAATLVASALKENGVTDYCVASTGNIANAFSNYLAKAGISLHVFMPIDALKANEAEVSSYGQRMFRVNGDYALAKKFAAEFSKKHNILISGGNIDPMRVESKRTMVFEWLRLMPEFPTVYVQALAGGTGPIAIAKGFEEIKNLNLVKKMPRMITVQPHKCAPMVHAWEKAKANNFPENWENTYPIYENPPTAIPTLAAGNPVTYPIIAKLTKETGGEIVEINEDKLVPFARLVAYETFTRIGPASTVAVSGFFKSLKNGHIKNGDVVLVNVGEGVRRAPEFMEQMIYTTKLVNSVDECLPTKRSDFKTQLWNDIEF